MSSENDSDLLSSIGLFKANNEAWLDKLERCRQAELNGNSEASLQLGFIYEDGIGVERDHGRAAEHFLKAAMNGNAYGYFHLGRLARDRGDYNSALNYWKEASEMGDTLSESFIGIAHLNGEGVDRSAEKAFEIFSRTATAGDPEGRYRLAICYRDGIGVEPNRDEAVRILGELKDANDERAWMEFAKFYHDGIIASDDPLGSTIKCVRKAAELGLPQAVAWLSERGYHLKGDSY